MVLVWQFLFQNVPKSCDDLKLNISLSVSCCHAAVSFTDDEKEQLRKFTNRSYLLDKTSRHQVWLSLVDVLLAYCYEVRSTEGEHTVSERECVCVCLSVSKCVKRLLLWAALSLGWQSPRSSNPLDPPSISFRALRDYPQICELSPGCFVSPLRGSGTKARWTWPILSLKAVCHTFYLKRRQKYLIQKNFRGDKICYMWAAFLYSIL